MINDGHLGAELREAAGRGTRVAVLGAHRRPPTIAGMGAEDRRHGGAVGSSERSVLSPERPGRAEDEIEVRGGMESHILE
ncbi:hypothetical protein NDU88_005503 [Pleurodeles waltl]|uniref:Uncharacterized protein n=1 Tax=Pleurodeles waltl TaxID=8319 RepID=A0AAV7TVP8_PLEWA|nr:hypothetical protein NDU88_005503 [Pleurodeles waltl]